MNWLTGSRGSTPRLPRSRVLPTHSPPREASAFQPLGSPEPSVSASLPTAGLLLPGWMQKRPGVSAATQTEAGQGRELGGCFPFLLGSLPNFFPIPGTTAHLGRRSSLGRSGLTTPGGKPWILDVNLPEREKASAGAAPCPPDTHVAFLILRASGRGGPTHLPRHSEGPSRQEASFSLCKALGSFLFLCILLAILYPVWEFQEHLPLSSAQPHLCERSPRA